MQRGETRLRYSRCDFPYHLPPAEGLRPFFVAEDTTIVAKKRLERRSGYILDCLGNGDSRRRSPAGRGARALTKNKRSIQIKLFGSGRGLGEPFSAKNQPDNIFDA
jgi:hypothetical protein